MKYITNPRNQAISKNTSVQPDGFSSWLIVNQGDSNVVIDDIITVPPGERYGFDLQPYVEYADTINIVFVGGTTNNAILIQQYNREVV